MDMKKCSLWLSLLFVAGCQASDPSKPTTGIILEKQTAFPQEETVFQPNLQASAPAYQPDQLIVRLSEGADLANLPGGLSLLRRMNFGHPYACLKVADPTRLESAKKELLDRGIALSVAYNYRRMPLATYLPIPCDEKLSSQWSLERTQARDWWNGSPTLDQSKVIVAILDTGLDVNHLEFNYPADAGRIVGAKNCLEPEKGADVTDDVGHGTHCAGIIGASGNNAGTGGMAGLAWDAKLMPVRVLGKDGGDDASILAGIDTVVKYNDDPAHTAKVRVINMSLGSSMYNQYLAYDDAFQYARSKGIIVCVAAGNDSGAVGSPANNRYCLSVSSTSVYKVGTNLWEMLSGFSNRGDRIDLAAPGGNIWSTIPGGYGYMSGTSMATPFVAGLAALVIAQQDPNALHCDATFVDQVMQHLEGTADDLGAPGKDVQFGWGRVNVKRAMTENFPAALP